MKKFKINYILQDYSYFVCNMMDNNNKTAINLMIHDKVIVDNLSDIEIIQFFARLMRITFDFNSFYYKPIKYSTFIFESDGIVAPSMTDKLISAQVKYNINKKYVLTNTEYNNKYFLKFFPPARFDITDSIKTLHCFNHNQNTSREFIVFVNVYSKINDLITCKIKYKIYF